MPAPQADDIGTFLGNTFDDISNRIAGGERKPIGRRAFELSYGKVTEAYGGKGWNLADDQFWNGHPDHAGSFNDEEDQLAASELGYTQAMNYKGSLAWGGHANGQIASEHLVDIGGGQMLEEQAARSWQIMVAAAAREGVDISLIDSYRSYEDQVRIRKEKGHQVATAKPGTSNHGWARAVDVARGPAREWIQRNGRRFGWIWPQWAQRRGTKSFEPWHFEFRGRRG